MQIRSYGVIRTSLVTPFGVRDDGVVVIHELPTNPQADTGSLRISKLDVCKLEVPGIFIRWAVRRILRNGPGVLDLRNEPEPIHRLQVHLIPESIQAICIVTALLKAAIPIIF